MSLSDKRNTNFREEILGKIDKKAFYLEEDVKEFIQDLGKELYKKLFSLNGRACCNDCEKMFKDIQKIIRKKAGDKLC